MTRCAPRTFLPALAASVLAAAAGCGTASTSHTGMPGMAGTPTTSASGGANSSAMPGMNDADMPTGDGLSATTSGYTFRPATTKLTAGKKTPLRFQILDAQNTTLTSFADDQTKLMHFYLIRADLTGFQHLHPTMASDGTWTVTAQPLQAGSWRAYASFIANDMAGKKTPLVLSTPLSVAGGKAMTTPLPTAAATTHVDGYTLTLDGAPMANTAHALTITVNKAGKPVTDLQPYLNTYAHLTAFHQHDMAFAHLHPHGTAMGAHGGPTLTFEATLPKTGNWRLFVQFQTAGTLHTAAITVTVG
jgi:hypothetical protein